VGDLPAPRTHQAVAVYNSSIYLLGGGEGSAATTTIWRADVGSDGSLGAWTEAGELPEARATSAAFFRGEQLYVVAGMTTLVGQEVATVLHGKRQADGTIAEWEEESPLPQPRAHSHQAPIFGTTLYSLGGSIDHIVQSDVYQAEFLVE
jgi:N-acetylneuraminic acid mutarotase